MYHLGDSLYRWIFYTGWKCNKIIHITWMDFLLWSLALSLLYLEVLSWWTQCYLFIADNNVHLFSFKCISFILNSIVNVFVMPVCFQIQNKSLQSLMYCSSLQRYWFDQFTTVVFLQKCIMTNQNAIYVHCFYNTSWCCNGVL